jgi:hypothetical protein
VLQFAPLEFFNISRRGPIRYYSSATAFGLIPGMRIDGEHVQNTEAAARRVKAVQ